MSEFDVFVPFHHSRPPSPRLSPERSYVFGRFAEDMMSDCLLYRDKCRFSMKTRDVADLRTTGFNTCYMYEVMDIENREFTVAGYRKINDDLRRAIDSGFTHICASNAYIIELLCNEYASDVKVVISAVLEVNSARARVFFDVLNSTESVSHVVVSQNRLTSAGWRELKQAFPDVKLIVEVDRWTSDIQMVHEHYYNMVFGQHNDPAVRELRRFVSDTRMRRQLKPPDQLFLNGAAGVKVGELGIDASVVESNLASVLDKRIGDIQLVDQMLWSAEDE